MPDIKDKKMLLIFPPQWTPISPHFALPQLVGQLKSNGFNAQALDLNIEFFNEILTFDNLQKSITKAKRELELMQKNLLSVFSVDKKASDYTFEEQIFLFRYNKIKKFLQANEQSLAAVPLLIENAKKSIKNDDFYIPSNLIESINLIDRALEIVSLPYSPTKIEFEGISNPFFKFNYNNIKYFVEDSTSNIFNEFYERHIYEIIEKQADFIAISLNSSSQIVPGLTLTYMLKKRTNAHINIGGNFFGRIADELKKHKEFFLLFADSVSVEEGEGPIVEVAKYVNGIIPIQSVPNLLYFDNGCVYQNEKMKPVKLDDMANMDLSDYDFSKYYAPKVVVPYQSSRGCYWGKCSFCDQDFGQNFNVKKTDKVISEFKEFKDKYNITNFEFIDESVSPSYLKELSLKLEENNLKVNFFIDARLETDFSKEILFNAHKNGLQMILWGLESGSDDVLKLINKGIDLNKRFEILKNSKDSGIWNFAFIFFGFPTETKEDALKTIKMLTENNDIIHSYGRSVFTMGRHAKLSKEPEKYGITKIYPAEDEFSPNIKFDSIGMNSSEMKEVLEHCLKECSKAYNNPLWMYLRYREWLFLYIAKYGSEWVKNCAIISEKESL
mgnify:CR=1 FL=1